MRFRHWKIQDTSTKKVYFVPIEVNNAMSVMNQVANFMHHNEIKGYNCRIIENSSRILNMMWTEFVLKYLKL